MKIERITEEKIETIMVSDENFNLVIYAPPGKMKDEDVEGIIEDYRRRKVTKGFREDQSWLVKDGDWITVNGKHVFIGEGENFEIGLHGPKFSVSREGSTRSYSLEGDKGKADVDIYDKDLAVIDIVEVPEKERGKGYGRYLVNRIESDLRESGVKTIHVSAVPSAIPFWDKLGYKPYLEKPDVSGLPLRSANAKLEVWEGRRGKDLKSLGKRMEKEESNSMYLPRHSCMLIWSGVKTLIVKEKHFEGMLKKKMNLCDDNYKYGDIVLTRMFEMTREEVDRSRKRSRLTDLDMEDWKGAKIFYGYDFEFEPLEEPQEVKVPHGAQTFFNIEKAEGPTLPEYEELAKPGEPLPDKYYKFHSSVKDSKFVLQRHYPTGKKVPIKPGEEEPQMHKSFVIEYDEKHPEALTGLMSDLIDQYEELDEKERVKIEKSTFGVLFEGLVVKIRDHLDLRMEISDSKLVGVTIHPPVPGGITAWDAFKSRMTGEEKTQVTPKFEHPHPWLTREGELRFPTRHKEPQEAHYLEVARMDIIDTGPVKFGVQREDLHEFFFYGKILKGRWVIRKLKIGTEAAHWAWLLMKPSDQRPLDPVLHRDNGHIKIERVAEPTTEERSHIEEETQAARAERGQEI